MHQHSCGGFRKWRKVVARVSQNEAAYAGRGIFGGTGWSGGFATFQGSGAILGQDMDRHDEQGQSVTRRTETRFRFSRGSAARYGMWRKPGSFRKGLCTGSMSAPVEEARKPFAELARRDQTRLASKVSSAREKHAVNHMDHAVRLVHVSYADQIGTAIFIKDIDIARRTHLRRQCGTRERVEVMETIR